MKAALLKFWNRAIDNPKTSLSGLFGALAVIAVALRPYVTNKDILTAFAIIGALAKAFTLLNSTDADTQLAMVPGKGDPVMVPAHNIPDDPNAIPVKEN